MNFLRKLVWLYLFLLIFEGALRKWGIPALSAPLLLIRDPVVLLIYFHALRCRLSFHNGFNAANLVLAVLTVITATLFGIANPLVTIYGVLADYFQIPLIFLIPQILNRDDVLLMGKFFLYVVPLMAALTVLQFLSPQESIWNLGAMATHYGTVRPSGTFSFNNGLSYFFAFSSVFLLFGFLYLRTYPLWLLVAVTFFTLVASGCSGSRSCIVYVGIVVVAAVFCVVKKGRGGVGLLAVLAVVAIAIVGLSYLSVFKEGAQQLGNRFSDAGANEGGAEGFVERYFGTFLSAFWIMPIVPFFGEGLGTGTNGALALFAMPVDLPWVENEWERLVFECGPVLGLALCGFRIALTCYVGLISWTAFRRDNILPLLLFSACGLLVLNGQWGGPVPLGFAIFGAGITLAACHEPEEMWDEPHDEHVHDHEHEHADDEHSPAHDPV